jgi:hypothetical protein
MSSRVAAALRLLGGLALSTGKVEEAHASISESLRLSEMIRNPQSMAWAQIGLGKVCFVKQQIKEACHMLEEALTYGQLIGDEFDIAASLDWLAILSAVQGKPTQAAQMWGTSQAWRELTGTPQFQSEQQVIDTWTGQVRATLGKTSWSAVGHKDTTAP